jgi:HEAT repeat protein
VKGIANYADSVAVLSGKGKKESERLKALHTLFARRSEMTDEQVRSFWSTLRSVAQEKAKDPKFTADAIWAMGDVGVLARLRGVMTEEEVAQEARFLLDLAQNKATDPIIQRVAVAALGDLRVMEAAPWLEQLVRSPGADVQPNVLRSAAIALPKLTGTKAVAPLSQLLSTTDNKDVFGTAAYALGTVGAPESLPTLVANRLRLGDNLSVDNAINGMSSNVIAVLSRPSDPQITDAIAATRSLWREEQQKEYVPLLQQLVQNRTAPVTVRQAALQRLLDHAAHQPFEQEKAQLAAILPSIQQQPEFQKETEYINQRLSAQVLTPNTGNSP